MTVSRRKRTTDRARGAGRKAACDGPTADVPTLPQAAAYLQLAELDVLRLGRAQGLPGRQVGSERRFLKAAVQDWLRATPAPRSNKEAWLALAGVWEDDPFRADLLEDIHRRRGGR